MSNVSVAASAPRRKSAAPQMETRPRKPAQSIGLNLNVEMPFALRAWRTLASIAVTGSVPNVRDAGAGSAGGGAGGSRELWFDPDLGHLEFSEKRADEFEKRAVAFFGKYLLSKP
jgi:hypothetical protein